MLSGTKSNKVTCFPHQIRKSEHSVYFPLNLERESLSHLISEGLFVRRKMFH